MLVRGGLSRFSVEKLGVCEVRPSTGALLVDVLRGFVFALGDLHDGLVVFLAEMFTTSSQRPEKEVVPKPVELVRAGCSYAGCSQPCTWTDECHSSNDVV